MRLFAVLLATASALTINPDETPLSQEELVEEDESRVKAW